MTDAPVTNGASAKVVYPTIAEMKKARDLLEQAVHTSIATFEAQYGVMVEEVDLHRVRLQSTSTDTEWNHLHKVRIRLVT